MTALRDDAAEQRHMDWTYVKIVLTWGMDAQ